jgi:hypothetical protein
LNPWSWKTFTRQYTAPASPSRSDPIGAELLELDQTTWLRTPTSVRASWKSSLSRFRPPMLRKRFQSWRRSLAQGGRLELATAHELEEPPRALGPEVALPDLELGVIRSGLPHSDKPHAVVSLSKKKRVSNLMSGKKFDQGWSFGRAGDGCYVQLGRC